MAGYALEQLLALAHPLMPFVTEECWSRTARRPRADGHPRPAAAPGPARRGRPRPRWRQVQEVVTALRAYRSTRDLPPRTPLLMSPAAAPLGRGARRRHRGARRRGADPGRHPARRRPLDRARHHRAGRRSRGRARPARRRAGDGRQRGRARARASSPTPGSWSGPRPTWSRPSARRPCATRPSARRSPRASPRWGDVTPGEARAWIAGLEILGMRFGLERIRGAARRPRQPRARARRRSTWSAPTASRSTARLASAALAGGGARVGTYLSPHVTDWPERIQIAGRADRRGRVRRGRLRGPRAPPRRSGCPRATRSPSSRRSPRSRSCRSARAAVDVAVVEAGLGGRYDATNVLPPRAAVVLTNIALEHTEFLGDTEARDRRREARGLRRRLRPAGGRPPHRRGGRAAVEAECARRGLRPLRYGEGLSARGRRRVRSRSRPRARPTPACRCRCSGGSSATTSPSPSPAPRWCSGAPLDAGAAARGDRRRRDARPPRALPGRPGRRARRRPQPGRHGRDGRRAAGGARRAGGPVVAVVSILGDKDAAGHGRRRSRGVAERVVATRSSHSRAVPSDELAALARALGRPAEAVDPPAAALAAAREAAGPGGVVVVAGIALPAGRSEGSASRPEPGSPLLDSRAPGRASTSPRRSRPSCP